MSGQLCVLGRRLTCRRSSRIATNAERGREELFEALAVDSRQWKRAGSARTGWRCTCRSDKSTNKTPAANEHVVGRYWCVAMDVLRGWTVLRQTRESGTREDSSVFLFIRGRGRRGSEGAHGMGEGLLGPACHAAGGPAARGVQRAHVDEQPQGRPTWTPLPMSKEVGIWCMPHAQPAAVNQRPH